MRDTDALGRLGGDEFVVLAEDVSLADRRGADRRAPARSAQGALLRSERRPARLTVTASIGVATGERASAEELLRDADIAMHRAKWEGKNRYVVFESGMQDVVQSRMELEMDLRGALDRDEFFLVYQPTFDLRGMAPDGCRGADPLERPVRGIVQPNDFIPLLEETGLIVDVGQLGARAGLPAGRALARRRAPDRHGRERVRPPARQRPVHRRRARGARRTAASKRTR